MVTKLKNNYKLRVTILIVILMILSGVTITFFPFMNKKAQSRLTKLEEESSDYSFSENVIESMYKACFVLNMEKINIESQDKYSAAMLYANDESLYNEVGLDDISVYRSAVNEIVDEWTVNIYESSFLDYCYFGKDSVTKNTSRDLDKANTLPESTLASDYEAVIELSFDEDGNFSVLPIYLSSRVNVDKLIKSFTKIDKKSLLLGYIQIDVKEGYRANTKLMNNPKNFKIIWGIPRNLSQRYLLSNAYNEYHYGYYYDEMIGAYRQVGVYILYGIMLAVIFALMLIATSQYIWKVKSEDGTVISGNIVSMNRPWKWYMAEAAIIGCVMVIAMDDLFLDVVRDFTGFEEHSFSEKIGQLLMDGLAVFLIYLGWYLSLRFIRPIFTLGFKEYIRQYSLCYQIIPWSKNKWEALKYEVNHIDFTKKSNKTLVKVLILNYIILAIIACCWFIGLILLIVYSLFLFIIISRYYKRVQRDYNTMLNEVRRMAEGNLAIQVTEDVGIFEPFKEELEHVREGFKTAVDEEVKSQRMKTELITNVSHDLKTPLTAITTYVELLKNPDITEEERTSYIETLEKKSLRLKVLIEDLFEVSKATTNNIKLDKMDVDVVNLIKQVSVEHLDKFRERGLELKWKLPENDEKIILSLDPQKTYRVFENLFVNIRKYSMENSRVYVEIQRKDEKVEIVMKNISATELNINPEELTERFVRGDSSRNTEGSGLGLAIAKSFTEAQGGKLDIAIDGDLFKVVILI